MPLESIYYIGQTVAVIVIVATLIAILVQGYQTNKIARADLTLNMWMQTGQMHYSLFDSPEKADFMHRAMTDAASLNESEKGRFSIAIGMAIGTHEASFNLLERNLVEAAAYNRNAGSTRLYMNSPRVRKWWRLNRTMGYDLRFRDIVDAMADEYEATQRVAPATQEQST